MKHNEQTDKLAEAIAVQWGGDFGVGTLETTESGYAFRADDGYSHYRITLPRHSVVMREIPDGRPYVRYLDEDGKLIVECLDDAPDCWWTITLDGWYEGFRDPFNVLTGEKRD